MRFKNKGQTLLEVVIVMTLLSLTSVYVMPVISQSFEANDKMLVNNEVYNLVRDAQIISTGNDVPITVVLADHTIKVCWGNGVCADNSAVSKLDGSKLIYTNSSLTFTGSNLVFQDGKLLYNASQLISVVRNGNQSSYLKINQLGLIDYN